MAGGNPDPKECPKYPGVKGDYLQYRKKVTTWMHECLSQRTKWRKVYKWWKRSLVDKHPEVPNPSAMVAEYEQAVYQQFGIIHPEQMLMIFRCVWEDLDMHCFR